MDLYLNKADSLINEKKPQEAVRLLKNCLTLCTESAENTVLLLRKLGECLYLIEDYKEALETIENISKYTNQNNKDFLLKAHIYKKLDRLAEAENFYYIALRKNPKSRINLKNFTDFMEENNKLEVMTKALRKIISLKPEKSINLIIYLLKYFIKTQQQNEALKQAKDTFLMYQDNHELLELMGDLYFFYEEYDKALDFYNKSINIFNDNIKLSIKIVDTKASISKATENFEFPDLSFLYNFLHLKEESKTLSIILSSLENKFILKGYDFGTDRLFISEKILTYYTYALDKMIDFLKNLILDNNYLNVNLIGSSKGSFGAILIGEALTRAINHKNISFKVVSFSPQTLLVPFNPNIGRLPSYKWLLDMAAQSPSINYELNKNGSLLSRCANLADNIAIDVIYGEQHERDKKEALRLEGIKKINIIPVLNYSFHTSILLYTKKGDALIAGLTKRFNTVSRDDAFFAPVNSEDLAREFIKVIDQYNYDLKDHLLL